MTNVTDIIPEINVILKLLLNMNVLQPFYHNQIYKMQEQLPVIWGLELSIGVRKLFRDVKECSRVGSTLSHTCVAFPTQIHGDKMRDDS